MPPYPIAYGRAEARASALFWATHWDSAAHLGDWRLASPSDPANPGGLDASGQIASAVVLSLFTDRRAPAGWRPDVADRRGWWGDAVAPAGEEPVEDGSHLWLLRNEVVTPQIAELARLYALEALAWLTRDRVAGGVTVESGLISAPERGIWLTVLVTDRSGALIYNSRFARLWREVR